MKKLIMTLAILASMATPARAEDLSFEDTKWFAEQGFAWAQNNLGVMYEKGDGVPQDDAEAVGWYRMAAEQGDASAQYNLGVMYRRGQGVPQDDAEAAGWYRMAAEQGDARAQNNLGAMYYDGRGLLQDYVSSYVWGNIASANGNEKSNEALKNLILLMTPEQIAEAQRLSRECFNSNYRNCP